MVVSDMQDVDSEVERQYCAFLTAPTNNNSKLLFVVSFNPFFFSFDLYLIPVKWIILGFIRHTWKFSCSK